MQVRFDKLTSGLALAFVLLLLPAAALAHDPRFVHEEKVIEVKNPDISQAFYGYLDGQAVLYKIKTDVPQKIYFQLLVPDVPNVKTDLKAEFTAHTADGLKKITLDGTTHQWTRWYEDYGGEWYFQGPDTSLEVSTGTQTIFISNGDLYGPYVLVVGEKESFPLDEMISAVKLLPQLHQQFFLKPWYSAFFNRIGLFLAIPVVVLALIVIGLVLAYRHSKRLLRRIFLVAFGLMLLVLDVIAVADVMDGRLLGMALDFAMLFASLAGYVGIYWVWKTDRTGIKENIVEPSKQE